MSIGTKLIAKIISRYLIIDRQIDVNYQSLYRAILLFPFSDSSLAIPRTEHNNTIKKYILCETIKI